MSNWKITFSCMQCHNSRRVGYLQHLGDPQCCGKRMIRVWNSTKLPKKKSSEMEWDEFFTLLMKHPYYKEQGEMK